MANQRWAMTTLEDGPHEWRQAWFRGWVDGQHRARWAPEYERMGLSQQIAYESGRLEVVNGIGAGFAVPRWNGARSGARAVMDWIYQAHGTFGAPLPPEFVEQRS